MTKLFNMMPIMRVLTILSVILPFLVDCVPAACEVDQYFDKDVNMCEYCHIICDNAEQTNTVLKCLKNCPDYLTTAKPTRRVPPTTAQTTQITLPILSTHLSSGHIVAIAVGVVVAVLVVVVTVAVVLYRVHSRRKRKQEKRPVMVEDDHNGEGEIAPGPRQKDKLITESTSTVGDCCV